jgi:TolA-binding protein
MFASKIKIFASGFILASVTVPVMAQQFFYPPSQILSGLNSDPSAGYRQGVNSFYEARRLQLQNEAMELQIQQMRQQMQQQQLKQQQMLEQIKLQQQLQQQKSP